MSNVFNTFAATIVLGAFSAAASSAGATSCVSAFGTASSSETDAFKAAPWSLMSSNPQGGGAMSRSTRELILAETDFSDTILSLASAANSDQRAAFGVGLGQATLACERTKPEVAQQISLAVLSRGTGDLLDAYKTVIGDIDTFAISPSPAPAASPLGGRDATLQGGGEGSAGGGGVTQSGPGEPSFSSSTPVVVTALRFSTAQAASGAGDDGSQSSSPPAVVTVPGPVLGEGPFGLIVTSVFGYLALRAYSRRRLSSLSS